jgi:hypothetical protein
MTDDTVTLRPKVAANAQYCRQQAEQLRQLAEAKSHLRGLLLGIAAQYEEAAQDLEEGAAPVRNGLLLPPL